MIVSNPSTSVTSAFVQNVSGALWGQLSYQASQIEQLSGTSIIDGILYSTTGSGPATRLIIDTYNSTNVFGSSVRGRRARGTSDTPSGVLANDVLLQLVGDGFVGTGFLTARASITLVANADWTTGSTPARLSIRLVPTSGTATIERLRIDPDGHIGINNDNPQYALDVSGGLNLTQGLSFAGAPFVPTDYASTGVVKSLSGWAASTLSTTGATLWERDLSISGALVAQIELASAGVLALNSQVGFVNLQGKGTTSISALLGTITISGAVDAQVFNTVVPTGVSSLTVTYPAAYSSVPLIHPTIASAGNIVYQMTPQGITTSSYTALLSDTVLETGVTITTLVRV